MALQESGLRVALLFESPDYVAGASYSSVIFGAGTQSYKLCKFQKEDNVC